ncbi:MAG TPA: biotin--[acetyl-CoA-carboxylase] ligase [Burkholderiales bacterium]|nr:biotin--[acetyl-CoA-carboxylase] ligase [Burkholderiales bacterium]
MAEPPVPLTFRALRLLSAGEFRSGEALASSLGVSRTSVWNALRGLEKVGVTLLRLHGRGYRLAAPIDWLDPAQLRRHLGVQAETYELQVVEMVESTNTTLLEQAVGGAAGGLMLAAELQTRGRGRRGRAWYAGLGGALTFSVLWRFDQGAGFLSGLGLAVGVALVRALRGLGLKEAMLKWPNDLVVRHHKIAGTLVEIQGDVLGPSLAVVGVGINFRLDPSTRQNIDQAVTDLVTEGGPHDRNRVLGQILVHLAQVVDAFRAHGFGPLRSEWDSYHVHAGRPVTVRLPDGAREEGTAAGVGEDGALLLQTRAGLRRFHSGEVSLRAADEGIRRSASPL